MYVNSNFFPFGLLCFQICLIYLRYLEITHVATQHACRTNGCHLEHDNFILTLSATGIVVAVLGKESGAGDFLVQDVLDAGLPPQIEFPLKSGTPCISFAFYNPIKHTHDICMGSFAQTLATQDRLGFPIWGRKDIWWIGIPLSCIDVSVICLVFGQKDLCCLKILLFIVSDHKLSSVSLFLS